MVQARLLLPVALLAVVLAGCDSAQKLLDEAKKKADEALAAKPAAAGNHDGHASHDISGNDSPHHAFDHHAGSPHAHRAARSTFRRGVDCRVDGDYP